MRSSSRAEAEFSKLFKDYYGPLVMYAFRFTDDQSSAEDIVEDLFIKLWTKMDRLDSIHSIKSYLFTMARNASLNWIEKSKNERVRYHNISLSSEHAEDKILDNLVYAEMMSKIYSVMDQLPEQCRKVFSLHYIEGKKISEIAVELNISRGTVFTHKYRGLQIMQKAISGLFMLVFNLLCHYV